MEVSAASAAVAKVVAMDTRGKTLEKLEPILYNLEKVFANNPNFETVYRASEGNIIPDLPKLSRRLW